VSTVVVLVVAVPLLSAAVTLCLLRHRRLQRVLCSAALTVNLGLATAGLVGVERNGSVVVRLGGWATDVGIALVMDRLAAVMVLIGAAMVLVVHVFAIGQGTADGDSAYYEPTYLALAAGVSLAFVAGDLFHLFVAVEVLLMASYVLITLEGTDAQIASGTTYTVLNVIESFVLFLAVGLVYAATGTVNMAALAERVGDLPGGVSLGLNLLLLLAFGLKAAVFPLFFWLPDSYPTAPSPVTAVFAGLLTKIGVYALIRTEATVFPGQQRSLLLIIGALTIVVGALGALAQGDMKRILSFHIVSQIGYMVVGVGLGTTAAIAATILFVIHQIPVKTALFLVEGTLERAAGTSRLSDIGGMLTRSGTLAVLFALPALSLAGIPPLSGFVGKLGLINAAIGERAWWVVGVALVGSLLTLVSMAKIWTGVFWGEPRPEHVPVGIVRRNGLMSAATIVTVAATLAIAVAAGPVVRFAERAARDLAPRSVPGPVPGSGSGPAGVAAP
jgi:multicomponent Na+:H+ antiporter subunit D